MSTRLDRKNVEKSKIYATSNRTYYYNCLCGKLAAVLDITLNALPKRRKDDAVVIDSQKYKTKLNTSFAGISYIRRDEGVEVQYKDKCISCNLPLFYRHKRNSHLYFIINGAFEKSFTSSEQQDVNSKIVMTKKVAESGKHTAVTLSTVDNENDEITEEKESSMAYESNAAIIQRHLKRKHT